MKVLLEEDDTEQACGQMTHLICELKFGFLPGFPGQCVLEDQKSPLSHLKPRFSSAVVVSFLCPRSTQCMSALHVHRRCSWLQGSLLFTTPVPNTLPVSWDHHRGWRYNRYIFPCRGLEHKDRYKIPIYPRELSSLIEFNGLQDQI